jgi:hypothetical protein
VIRRGVYRSRQFFVALLSGVSTEEMAEARRVLGPDLYTIFAPLPKQYRRHAFNVYRRVVDAGCIDRTVQQAALLHDAGKFDPSTGCYVTIIHRVIVVLLEALPLGRPVWRWLSKSRPRRDFVLYPFYLSRNHPSLGAKFAAKHGASSDLVALIAGHHTHGVQSRQLSVLQAADDKS